MFNECPVTNGMCEQKCKCPDDGKVKLVGIACDKYKTKRFEKKLKKKGFVHYEVNKSSPMMNIIKVATFPKDMNKLQKVIQDVNKSFQ